MSLNRKDFLKTLCLSGACIGCLSSRGEPTRADESLIGDDKKQPLHQAWLGVLLSAMSAGMDKEEVRSVMKRCSIAHFDDLKMDELLSPYKGKMDAFIKFLEDEWGWIINFDETSNVLIADENKEHCVCPVVEYDKEVDSSALCYCSEGFAERMFSMIWEKPVSARVISSIRRGDKRCCYEVNVIHDELFP
jgi:hypothetical protein